MNKTLRVILVCLAIVMLVSVMGCKKMNEAVNSIFVADSNLPPAENGVSEIDEIISLVLDSPKIEKEFIGQELLDVMTVFHSENTSQDVDINDGIINVSVQKDQCVSCVLEGLYDGEQSDNIGHAYLLKVQPSRCTREYQFSVGYNGVGVDMFIINRSEFSYRLNENGDCIDLYYDTSRASPMFSFKTDAWYYVLIALDNANSYTFYMWEEDNISNFAYFNYDWSNDIDYNLRADELDINVNVSSEDSNFNIDSLSIFTFDKSNEAARFNIKQYILNEKQLESAETAETTSTSESKDVPSINNVALPLEVSDYSQFLTPLEDGSFYVEFDPAKDNNLQLNRPNMPTYTWYINGDAADTISEVVIEFDILDAVRSLHCEYFGYDRAYFITLHHFETIPVTPPWATEEVFVNSSEFFERGDTTRETMIEYPELGEDLQKYVVRTGEHVRIAIPYAEFQSTAKDLTLQFLPGTTFANLTVNLWGTQGLDKETIQQISIPAEIPERDLFNDVISPITHLSAGAFIPIEAVNKNSAIGDITFRGVNDETALANIYKDLLELNEDGSVNMPVVFYDLDEYSDEIKGKYAVIPEGLVSALTIMSHPDFYTHSKQRKLADFIFENMVDETGQFYGVFDIEQGKLVAKERKVAALPILASMLQISDVLTIDEIDFLMNSIIAYDIIRVGDTLYYAPNGISENGVMALNLSDFAINDEFFLLVSEYSLDGSRLDKEFGCAMLLEGFVNSLQLVLEAQEQNETRLPSEKLTVIFSSDGASYELQPSNTFDITNSFFSMGLGSYDSFLHCELGYEVYKNEFENRIKELKKVDKQNITDEETQIIRECEAIYSEMYNVNTIANICYESWLNVYDFLKVQPSDNIYAPKYNVHTGEMIEANTDTLYYEFSAMEPFIKRFGTPGTSINYHFLVSIFNDSKMVVESAHLTIISYHFIYHDRIFFFTEYDPENLDFYTDCGFNLWGYDTLQHASVVTEPATQVSYRSHERSGSCMNREDWRAYMMRKINEFYQDEDSTFKIDDVFPMFYDSIPEVEFS